MKTKVNKKRIILILFIIVLSISLLIKLENKKNIYIEEDIVIKFAGDRNYPPYEYVDNDGYFKGFNIDIVNAIASEMGIKVRLIPMNWNTAIKALDNKEVDGLLGMAKNGTRLNKYNFVNYTFIRNQVIFVNNETTVISDMADLKGMKVAYQINDYNESVVANIPSITLVPKVSFEETLDALYKKEVDAAVGNRLVGIYFLQKTNKGKHIKIIGDTTDKTEYGIATLKSNEELHKLLQEGLTRIKKDDTYDKIYKKWFGEEANYSKVLMELYRRELLLAALLVIIIILLLYIYNTKLQKEVSKRTCELELANKDLIRQQKEIYNLAYFDSTTSLPNRLFFVEELEAIYSTIGDRENTFGILYLDLDKFKHINDTLSHYIGDYLLKLLGIRISKILSEGDILARGGGDEYFILMKNIKDHEDAIEIAMKIIEDFKIPYYIKEHELYLTTSIGIAVYPEGGLDSNNLMKNADLALYKAKELGGNSCFLYNKEIESKGLERMILLNQLRQSIDNDELVLHFQPQVSINSGKIVGVEALIRWNHPERGLLYPDKFIYLAEEAGLIIKIGEWVLKKACNQAKEWIDKGHNIMISVNISVKQFQHKGFIDEVLKIIKESELNPKNLTIEITETIAISDIEYTLFILNRLKEEGISVAIDDFGTGYSSLSYLNDMNVNELKIDRSFIWDIEKNEKNKMISNTIIILAKQLGLKVTAEGVENKEQLEILRKLQCDIAQGYYFSKPVPKEKIEKMIN